MQHSKVIAYVSRQLGKHDKNYVTHDLELPAIIRHCTFREIELNQW